MTPVPICTMHTTQTQQHVSPWTMRVPISGQLQCAIFHATGYANMKRSRATIPEQVIEMEIMNRGVQQDELSETSIARAVWEGKATMGSTGDGSVQDQFAT